MYFSIDSYKSALDNVSNQQIDNAFFGLLFMLKEVSRNQLIVSRKKLKFFSGNVSVGLNKHFSFTERTANGKDEYLLLSDDFAFQVKNNLLHRHKVDLLSIIVLCTHQCPLTSKSIPDIFSSFSNEFGLDNEIINEWFLSKPDSITLSFSNSPITLHDLSKKIGTLHHKTISFDGASTNNFYKGNIREQQKFAGDWGASGFLQKFKPTTGTGNFAAVLHSDLISSVIDEPNTDSTTAKSNNPPSDIIGYNKIFYGAPGTGKSHKVHHEITHGCSKHVTVFHSDTLYSDFVGTLKPKSDVNEDGDSIVKYEFRPGPFTNALIDSLIAPNDEVFLIIEEINRSHAASVFGELFQLLDRNGSGASEYSITPSDPDMLNYINNNLLHHNIDPIKTLSIPNNMTLLATMNSSDQAVVPLDTAFKRRWSFEYLGLNFKSEAVPKNNLEIVLSAEKISIPWEYFANNVINAALIELNVPEDRLIGPFFLNIYDLKDAKAANEAIASKLFIYIWDDILRNRKHERMHVFSSEFSTFSTLYNAFLHGKPVFSLSIENVIKEYKR